MKRNFALILSCYILFFCQQVQAQPLVVWPGDATNNGIVNNLDFLQLGLAYNFFGPARDSFSGNSVGFLPQEATPWAFSFSNGLNFAYADCNGDGAINYYYDAFPIYVHYGAQRPGPVTPDVFNHGTPDVDPALKFDASVVPASVQNGTAIQLPIVLGDSALPVEDLYGLAFSIITDAQFVDANDINLNFNQLSWANPDNDRVFMYRPVSGNQVDVSWTRTDQNQRSGHGAIGSAEIIVIIDVLGLQAPDFDIIIDNIRMIDKFGNENVLAGDTLTIAVAPQNTSSAHSAPPQENLRIFPNPAHDYLRIQVDGPIAHLWLTDALGNLVVSAQPQKMQVELPLSGIGAGVYWLEVETSSGRYKRRVILAP